MGINDFEHLREVLQQLFNDFRKKTNPVNLEELFLEYNLKILGCLLILKRYLRIDFLNLSELM